MSVEFKPLHQIAHEIGELYKSCSNLTIREIITNLDQASRDCLDLKDQLEDVIATPHPTVTEARNQSRKAEKKS
jgi:hypothetical protein